MHVHVHVLHVQEEAVTNALCQTATETETRSEFGGVCGPHLAQVPRKVKLVLICAAICCAMWLRSVGLLPPNWLCVVKLFCCAAP